MPRFEMIPYRSKDNARHHVAGPETGGSPIQGCGEVNKIPTYLGTVCLAHDEVTLRHTKHLINRWVSQTL